MDFEVIVNASITVVVWQIFHGHQRFSKVDLLPSTADACEVHRVYFTLHKSPKSPKSPGRHRVEAEADARHEIKWSQSEEDITLRVLVDAETTPTQWDAVDHREKLFWGQFGNLQGDTVDGCEIHHQKDGWNQPYE